MGQVIIETVKDVGLGDFIETIHGDTGKIISISININGTVLYHIQSDMINSAWITADEIYEKTKKVKS